MNEMPESPEMDPLDPAAHEDVHSEGHGAAGTHDDVSADPGAERIEDAPDQSAAADLVPTVADPADAAVVALPPDDAVSETVTEPEEIDEPFSDEEAAELRNIVEALVFASDEPMPAKFMRQIIEDVNRDRVEGNRVRVTTEGIKRAVAAINRAYADRAFHIISIAGGFAFATKPKYSVFVGKLAKEKARRKLSAVAIESLAIIAYKQPITKSEIEFIRGVNADYIIKTLLEKNLITITGRASTAGRPLLYGTTDEFLKHFGLNEITDLPKPREIEELIGETELEVEKRMLAEQQELEFKDELSQKLEGGQKPKQSGSRPPLRQQTGRPAEKGPEPAVSTPPAPEQSVTDAAPTEHAVPLTEQTPEEITGTVTAVPVEEPIVEEAVIADTPIDEPVIEEALVEEEPVIEAAPVADEPIEEPVIESAPVADEPIEVPVSEEMEEEDATDELLILDEAGTTEPAVEEVAVEDAQVEAAPIEETLAIETPIEIAAVVEEEIEVPAEAVVIEEAPIEEPTIEEPLIEEAAIEEPSVEEPQAEEAAIEEVPVEVPVVEDTPIEEAQAEEAVIEETPVEEPQTEEAAAEEAEIGQPAAEEPTPAAENELIETPTAEAAALDGAAQPASDDALAGQAQDGEAHGPEKGWSKWKTKIKTFFKKLFE